MMADVAESGSQDTMFADEETGQYLSARYIVVTRSASTGIPISHFVCVCYFFIQILETMKMKTRLSR
jgi:hypothetical protein